jgi:hypothetical protein
MATSFSGGRSRNTRLLVPRQKSERSRICILAVQCVEFKSVSTIVKLERARVAQCVRYLDYLTTHTSLSPMRRGLGPGFVYYRKGALDSQPQVIKFTSCLPMVGGSLRVLRLCKKNNYVNEA